MKEFKAKNGEALKELTSAVKDEMEKVNAVLTPEQKTKLKTLKDERKEAREECLAHRIAHLKISLAARRVKGWVVFGLFQENEPSNDAAG